MQAVAGSGPVACEGRDVDQGGDATIRPGVSDQGAAVRVADEDHGSTDPPEGASDALHVAFQRVQAMLGAHHFVPVRLQRGKHEPSAQSPWANTILGLFSFAIVRLLT